jgi:hypothetical protein
MEERRFHNVVRDVFDTNGGRRRTRDEDLSGISNHNGNLGFDVVSDSLSYTPPPFCSGIQPGCLGRRYLRAARAVDWWLLAVEQIPPAH